MPDTFSFAVKGLDELQAKFESMPKNIAKKGLRKALKAGGDIVQDGIVERAPEKTGFMKEHFGQRIKISSNELAGSAFIGPEGKMDYPDADGSYRKKYNLKGKAYNVGRVAVASVVRFFEFGTRKMAKKPFMTEGFESTKTAALDSIIKTLKEAIDEEAK